MHNTSTWCGSNVFCFLFLFLYVLQEEGPQVKRSSSPPHGAPKKRTAFIDITNVSPALHAVIQIDGQSKVYTLVGDIPVRTKDV